MAYGQFLCIQCFDVTFQWTHLTTSKIDHVAFFYQIINGLFRVEDYKPKAPRSLSAMVTNDLVLHHLAKLGKEILEVI